MVALIGCGGGDGGDSCDGLGGLSIACADLSIDVSTDPEVEAQVEEFYDRVKQKSPFFNQDVIQTSEKYGLLSGIYQSDHQSENISISQFYAISPKGYIVEDHGHVGNLFNEPDDHFSMIFLPSDFWEISITRAAGGEILEHARTHASFKLGWGASINTSDEQVTYVSAGTDSVTSEATAPESPYSSNDPAGNGPDGTLGNADDVTIKDLYEVDGLTFVRSPLSSEAPDGQWGTASGRDLNRVGTNRYFRKFTWENADAWCKSFNGRLATGAEIETHIAPISGTTDGIWETQLNWPQQSSHYWTGSVAVDDPGDGSRHKAWITYETSNGNSVHQVQGHANTNPFWPMCVLEHQALDSQMWDGFDFLNGYDIDVNSNVLDTPLRPGIYWAPVEYSQTDDQNFTVESVLLLELSQNGIVTAIEDEFEDQLAIGVNGTCKINGAIESPPDDLTIDTNFVLDASLVFESCEYNVSQIPNFINNFLYPAGSSSRDSLSDIAAIKTVLIPFDNLTYRPSRTPYSFAETGRGFQLVNGFTREQINIERVAPYFFELCKPDGTLSLQILEDAGYLCLYDPDEEMLVPIHPTNST